MQFSFYKMHGAGNDFILLDDREMRFPVADTDWIAGISARRTGIGCDGVILIQQSDKADFRMRFFNPDGGEVEMCGNGARCVARLAAEIGAAGTAMSIDTASGILRAEVRDGLVLLNMTAPTDWRMDQQINLDDSSAPYNFVNTGVPHAVVEVPDLDACEVHAMGPAIRYHQDFAPAGTNANFIAVTGPQDLRIRTYERGVEAETLACGTGMVAAALVAGKQGRVSAPVSLTCASGDVLEVNYRLTEDGADDVTLLGPAAHVFQGTLEHS